MEQCIRVKEEHGKGANGEYYEKLFALYGLKCIEADVLWYLNHKVISLEAAEKMEKTINKLVKWIAERVDDIIESMGVPEHMVWAPIARHYEKYNSGPNRGELVGSKL